MKKRKSIRDFSPEKFDIKLLEIAVKTSGSSSILSQKAAVEINNRRVTGD